MRNDTSLRPADTTKLDAYPARARLWLIALVLAAFLWRTPGLFAPELSPDEALFGLWARLVALGRDWFLVGQAIDKPPLAFYLQALSLRLLGDGSIVALRLPAFVASLLSIPLLGQLVWRLYRDEISSVLASSVLAFSPLAILYSPTAYLEAIWIACVLAAATAMASRDLSSSWSPTYSGFWFGLAVLTKVQALYYLPLLLLLGWILRWRAAHWRRWLLGLLPGALLLVTWDLTRPGSGILTAQLVNYGGLRLIASWELWPRLAGWSDVWAPALAMPVIFLALVLPLFLALLIQQETRETLLDQVFVLLLAGSFLLHWFVAVPVWERYVLLALPLAAILAGRLTARLWHELPALIAPRLNLSRYASPFLLVMVLAQVPSAARTEPLAAAPTRAIADYLDDEPYGTVLYDHWYSWEWRYHFLDEGVYVSWFPHPDALVEDLDVFARRPGRRYLALPRDERAAPVVRAVVAAGYRLAPLVDAPAAADHSGVMLYEVVVP